MSKHPKPEPRLCACGDHAFAVVDHQGSDRLHVAIVDPEDADLLASYRWRSYCPHFKISSDHRKDVYYLRRSTSKDGKSAAHLFHRDVLQVTGRLNIVDHRNHNGLDCRKRNLRIGTTAHNQGNTRRQINNTSGYKGVSPHRNGRWRAQIGANDYIGLFDCKHEAARAYNRAAKLRYGDCALLNEIREDAA